MQYSNDGAFNPEMYCLFQIYAMACNPARKNGDEKYVKTSELKHYAEQFGAITRTLVWLNLAQDDSTNPLGCRPVGGLTSLVMHRLTRRRQTHGITRSCELSDALKSINESALKEDALDEELQICVTNALDALRLVRYHKGSGRIVPTRELTNGAAEVRRQEKASRAAETDRKLAHGNQDMLIAASAPPA
jgi:hypothetical protein